MRTPGMSTASGRRPALRMICSIVFPFAFLLSPSRRLSGQATPLPDTTGFGVHVLALARDDAGNLWAGTYGRGIYRLKAGSKIWENIHHDSTKTSLSWDFVHAIAFGLRGEVWVGTVGNGWGLSTDGGATWRNWTLAELGPEWQYVAPNGIQIRFDTTFVATADGILYTNDDGAHWTALVDTVGPASKGPADTAKPFWAMNTSGASGSTAAAS